jgi:2-methylcitrate dehydratase
VQELLLRVTVTSDPQMSAQFPHRMPAILEVRLKGGDVLRAARDDYPGFHTRPFDWAAARQKFDRLARPFTTTAERRALADVIATLDARPIAHLTVLLGRVRARAPLLAHSR